MHQAILANGRFILAEDFARQGTAWIAENRAGLTCPECRQPAFFRRRSRDGRAPCFGSRHHLEECPFHTEIIEIEGELGDDVTSIFNEGTESELLLTGPFAQDGDGIRVREGTVVQDAKAQSHRHIGEEGRRARIRHMQLRTVLRNLVRNPAYLQDHDRTMRVPGRGIVRTTELIREFRQVSDADFGRRMLIWGAVETVRRKSDTDGILTVYVNAGNAGHNPFTIVLERQAAAALTGNTLWNEALEHAWYNTAPVHAIAFGKVHSGPGRSTYGITLSDLNAFAFLVGPRFDI